MDKTIEIAYELKKELDKLPLFIEYKRVKNLVENSTDLEDLKKSIALAKLHHQDEEHKRLLSEFNNHPLIVNYEALKNEVYNYLNQISEIVNKK